MNLEECSHLVNEGEEASKHSIEIAASIFEEAAKCFDKNGNRKKAGQYLTLAGDFFLDLNKRGQAASCYGKAIVRYLMADDIETAQILLEKGEDYGFSSETHQYRIALDAMERKARIVDEKGIQSEDEVYKSLVRETLPEIDILPIEKESEDLIPIEIDLLESELDIQIKKQDFRIPQLESDDPLKSISVLAAVSNSTRKHGDPEIQTHAFVKDKAGDSRFIEPQVSIDPIGDIRTSVNEVIDDNNRSFFPENQKEIFESDSLIGESTTIPDELTKLDTLELHYSATTKIENEYEEELVNIEVVDTIPFQWQVITIKSDFELGEKRRTTDGLVYTWKKEKIDPGKNVSVEYILRKRIERSIIIRRENQVSVVNLYNSIDQNLSTELNFVNTTGKMLQEILIEDVIPPELIIKNSRSSRGINPITIPTHDSTLFRWIFGNLSPGDNFAVEYEFREKPLTRYYIDEIETEKGVIKVEKISQPMIDSAQYEYIWMFAIENPIFEEISLIDRIPSDFELTMIDPVYLKPSLNREKTINLLSWHLKPKEILTTIVIRIRGKGSFTPLAPTISFSCSNQKIQLIDREVKSEKKLIDMRRLIEGRKEIS